MKWYITVEDYSYNRAYLLNRLAYSGEADIDFTNHSVHTYCGRVAVVVGLVILCYFRRHEVENNYIK